MESSNFDLLIPITAASDYLVIFPGSMVFGNKLEVDKKKKKKKKIEVRVEGRRLCILISIYRFIGCLTTGFDSVISL